MKKEVKTVTKSGNQLVVLNKLSLSMLIIDYVALGLALLGGVIILIATKVEVPGVLSQIGQYLVEGGIGIGVLSSFLAIGQFVLNKKVAKISDKLTPKISNIVFGVFFALFLLALVAIAVLVIIQNANLMINAKPTSLVSILVFTAAGLFLVGLIGQAIMSTIVMVKTKAK